MMDENLTDKQIIEHSKANPTEVFTDEKGRVVLNGIIYRSREEFETALRAYGKFGDWRKRFRRFFGRKA